MCAAASSTAHCSGSVSRVDAVQCGIVGPLRAPLESGMHPIVVVRESPSAATGGTVGQDCCTVSAARAVSLMGWTGLK